MNIHSQPEKWVPIDIGSEQVVLGSILTNSDTFSRVSSFLEPAHFFDPVHIQIYEIISRLSEMGKLVSALTVPAFMTPTIEAGTAKVKTKVYIARLAAESVPPDIAVGYAKHIREIAHRRRIAEIAIQMTPDAATDASQLASEAIEALDTVISSNSSWALPAVSMANVMTQSVDRIAEAYRNDGKIIGIPTGLRDLDHKLGGLQRGNLVLLAGRPGMGKSAVLLCLLRQAGIRDFRSLVFSKEMPAIELGERMISDHIFDVPVTHLPYTNLRTGSFHENMFGYVRDAALANAKLPIDVEEQSGLTMSQILTRARRYKRRHGRLDILAIDHIGLIQASDRYRGNRTNEIAEITGAAKAAAKELGCVVLLLSQLSRKVEERADKRPQLADLRDSGSIEQDADTVIFLYRPSYYLATSEPESATEAHMAWQRESEAAHNKLLAIIAKQRMGPTGQVELFCDIGNNAIRDLGHQGYAP